MLANPTVATVCGVVDVRMSSGGLMHVPRPAPALRLAGPADLERSVRRRAGSAVLAGRVGSDGLLVGVEAALRHLALAHRATGAAIAVGTEPNLTTGLDVAHVLDRERVDARHVLLTGCGSASDVTHLAELADWGFRLGIEWNREDGDDPLDLAAELTRRGRADRVVLLSGAAVPACPQDRAHLERMLHDRGIGTADVAAIVRVSGHTWLGGSAASHGHRRVAG